MLALDPEESTGISSEEALLQKIASRVKEKQEANLSQRLASMLILITQVPSDGANAPKSLEAVYDL